MSFMKGVFLVFLSMLLYTAFSSQKIFFCWKTQLIERKIGAADQIRTDDLLHGKQTLYQLSYNRINEKSELSLAVFA